MSGQSNTLVFNDEANDEQGNIRWIILRQCLAEPVLQRIIQNLPQKYLLCIMLQKNRKIII